MKKIIKTTAWVLMFAVCIWIGASFIDIVADNKSENPQHSDLNFFVLITEDEETRLEELEVCEINAEENVVALIGADGEMWVAEVDNAEEYTIGEKLVAEFAVNDPADLYDDEIKAFV